MFYDKPATSTYTPCLFGTLGVFIVCRHGNREKALNLLVNFCSDSQLQSLSEQACTREAKDEIASTIYVSPNVVWPLVSRSLVVLDSSDKLHFPSGLGMLCSPRRSRSSFLRKMTYGPLSLLLHFEVREINYKLLSSGLGCCSHS